MDNDSAAAPRPPRTAKALVVESFRAAIVGTADAADRAQAGAAEAVGAYRLAVHRARAAYRLVRHELGGGVRRRTRDLLRAAAIDHEAEQLVPVALAALAGWSLAGDTRITADAVIEAVGRRAPSPDGIADELRAAAAEVSQADPAATLDGAIPDDLRRRVLIRGVTESYRAARDAASGAHHSARRFRRWHRRCLDLALQLELLGRIGPQTQLLASRYAALAAEVGECADLLDAIALLRKPAEAAEPAEARADAPAVRADDELDALRRSLRAPLDERMRGVRDGARALFEDGGKTFARAVKAALRADAGDDAHPAAEADGDGDADPARGA